MLKLTDADYHDLARRLQTLVRAGEDAKGDLPLRWQMSERIYDNVPSSGGDDNMVRLHEPFSQPRIDALTAEVCGVVTRQNPYMVARDLQSGDRAHRLEEALHFWWERKPADFPAKARRASTIAANTNKAIWKLSWRPFEGKEGYKKGLCDFGISLEVIHPDNWVCVPAILDGLYDAKLCGNRKYLRRRTIKDRQASGVYLDASDRDTPTASLRADDTTGAIDRSRSHPDAYGEKDDELIAVYDLAVRIDLKSQYPNGDYKSEKIKAGEQLYRVLLAFDDPSILLFEPYPYSRPMYFESYYIADERNYWSGRSVAYNLQGPQEVHDLLFSGLYNAIMSEAMPLVIGEGLPEKYTKSKWGDVLNTEGLVNPPWASPSRFSGASALIFGIQENARTGDQTARVSQNTLGSVSNKDTTATEQGIVAGGVATGQEDYIANFSSGFGDMAEGTMELLEVHWNEWFPLVGLQPLMAPQPDPMTGAVIEGPVMDPMTMQPKMVGMVDLQDGDLEVPIVWEPMGKTPSNTPQARMQAVNTLAQFAAMPGSGIKPYELTRVAIRAADLDAENIQMTEEEMQMQAMQQQMMMDQQQQQTEGQANADKQAKGKAQEVGNAAKRTGLPPEQLSQMLNA